MIANKPRNK